MVVWTHLLKNHKNIGFLSNTCPDPLNNHKATKHSMLGHHRQAKMAFRWRANDDQLIMVFGSSLSSSTKKRKKVVTPLTKLSGSAHITYMF